MCTDGVEITEDDRFDRSTAVDVVMDNLLVNLLGIAVRGHGLLDRCILSDRQVLLCRLTINGAGTGENDTLNIVFGHEFQQIDE